MSDILQIIHATDGFLAKWRLRNKSRNSILMKCHYPDQGIVGKLLQPIMHYSDLGNKMSSVWNPQSSFQKAVLQNVSCFLRLNITTV